MALSSISSHTVGSVRRPAGISLSPLCYGTLCVTVGPPRQATAGSFCNDASPRSRRRLISVCVAALTGRDGVSPSLTANVFTVRNSGTQTGDKLVVLRVSCCCSAADFYLQCKIHSLTNFQSAVSKHKFSPSAFCNQKPENG